MAIFIQTTTIIKRSDMVTATTMKNHMKPSVKVTEWKQILNIKCNGFVAVLVTLCIPLLYYFYSSSSFMLNSKLHKIFPTY